VKQQPATDLAVAYYRRRMQERSLDVMLDAFKLNPNDAIVVEDLVDSKFPRRIRTSSRCGRTPIPTSRS
jgi:hypothetical protein